jgi:RHS repeat-associated protein
VYYYFLAWRLLGSLDSNGTQFYLSNAQGSLVSSFTTASGGATMKSNQLFGPYGNNRYNAGNLNTAKGFIGQYNDGTGLDYFNARYYDPVAGVFLSVDSVQGNPLGDDPYAYVGGNPETYSDPSGRYLVGAGGQTYYPGVSESYGTNPYSFLAGIINSPGAGTPHSSPSSGNNTDKKTIPYQETFEQILRLLHER